jgi:hypothetical protein
VEEIKNRTTEADTEFFGIPLSSSTGCFTGRWTGEGWRGNNSMDGR